jgi:hypothetical protein
MQLFGLHTNELSSVLKFIYIFKSYAGLISNFELGRQQRESGFRERDGRGQGRK